MTILPTSKAKKMRKEEKREEWSNTQGGESCHSHRHGISSHSSHSSHSLHPPHSSHPSHPSHSSHPSSISPSLPRKIARGKKGGVSSSLSSHSLPPSSSLLSSTQPLIVSPRGSREDHQSLGKEEQDGPNSDDEYDRGFRDEEMERNFESRLRDERGLEIKKMVGDGACLFRGVSHQIYGDEDMHGEVRRLCLDYMEKNREHFEQFITEDFSTYIARKRRPTVHGNHVELQAISEIYNRPIEIYEYNINPINVFHPKTSCASSSNGGGSGSNEKKEGDMNAPIRLSYHGTTHYNAVMDPRVGTVGVGLGLPSYEPGMADRQLIADAISKSEIHQIEQAMLNDKMSMTDWERTEEDLKDQVLRESYMEYARSMEESNQPSTSSSSRPPPPPPPPPPSSSFSSSSISRPHHSASQSRSPVFSSSPLPCSSRQLDTPDRGAMGAMGRSQSVGGSGMPINQSSTSSLYEELLMAEALEWNDHTNYESSLAEALIISQQTFLTECIRRPDGEGGSKD